MIALTSRPGAEADTTRGEWQAVHIFYAASPQPLLVQCVRPLVQELTADGLIDGHFFINYWLEGPHVRLRLRPTTAAGTLEVRERAATAIEGFLRRRPALYEMGKGYLGELYNTLFALEFQDAPPAELIGPDGEMRMAPNNSFAFREYEPEYAKYGGPAGVALAEWHFQHSSELVLRTLGTMNVHLRPILFGVSAQLMMVMAGSFLDDREKLLGFLDTYHQFWHGAFAGQGFFGTAEYEQGYGEAADRLRTRVAEILGALECGDPQRLPEFLRGWAVHCRELAGRVGELARRGELVINGTPMTDPQAALQALLFPFVHMTNNRFHVTIRDEAYLSYMLGRALRETLP